MNLSALNLDKFDTPGLPPIQGPDSEQPFVDPYKLYTIKRTSTGEEILLCSEQPPPSEVVQEAIKLNLPLFTLAEITHMKQAATADPAIIEHIIAVKLAFPGCTILRFQGAE